MDRVNRSLLVISIGLSLNVSSIIKADSVVQQIDRMDLDWGALKVRFFGTFTPATNQDDYKIVEQNALNEGLLYARDAVVKVHVEDLKKQGVSKDLAERSAVQASDNLTRASYPYQTSYYKGGAVRVYIESSLSKVFAKKDAVYSTKIEEDKPGRFSGLILRLDTNIPPTSVYEVVDQTGALLFSLESVSREAYERNLMGRWFVDPQREELIKYVGSKPVSIQVKVQSPNRLMVQKGAWTDALQDSGQVLSNSKIALVLPK